MNIRPWLVAATVLAPLASAACTPSASGSSGTSGAGGSTTTTATSTTTGDATSTTSAATSGTGGAGSCIGIFPAGACATCGEAKCCAEGSACDVTAGCIGCVYSSDPSCTTANKPVVDALLACMHGSCEAACFPPPPPKTDVTCAVPAPSPSLGSCLSVGGAVECNPITNDPCNTAAGEACDFQGNGYHCYPGPNDKSLCEACGPSNGGGTCKGGSTCLPGPDGTCGKFCCDSTDCGKGKCDKTGMLPGNVGYCLGGNP
ncbi:MAG: hypothetical protein ABJE95_32485 [Byssovorax sp.]